MFIPNAVILTGSLLGIIRAASNLGPDRVDREGVDPDKGTRVRGLIAADGSEKTIQNLE